MSINDCTITSDFLLMSTRIQVWDTNEPYWTLMYKMLPHVLSTWRPGKARRRVIARIHKAVGDAHGFKVAYETTVPTTIGAR